MSLPSRRASERPVFDTGWSCLARRRSHYDDFDDDDIDIGMGRPERPYEHPTTIGMIGFIFSGISLGLLIVVFVLWMFLRKENQGQVPQAEMERLRWMMYWFLILDVLSFFAGLTATIMGARGLAASNSLYRGYSMAALILGIVEMVATVIFGFIMTCVVLFVEVVRAGG